MTEQIRKVTLDYTFYNGQDQYSDGDIEKDLLQLIMEEPDVEKILAEDDRWPVLYHFSPVRQNILEWYPLKKGFKWMFIIRVITGIFQYSDQCNIIILFFQNNIIEISNHNCKIIVFFITVCIN